VRSVKVKVVNPAQKALLARLRDLIVETPKSGALNAAKKPLYVTRFAQAVERRADDGAALVEYVRAKIHEPPTEGYNQLIEAGRPDLTVEAVVADADAAWASEFSEGDRAAASERLGSMLQADKSKREAAEADAVLHDRKIVALVNRRRLADGKLELTAQQESEILARRAAERRGKA
jgi:hypothetical protein